MKITACHEYIASSLNLLDVNGPLDWDLKPMQLHANLTPLPSHCSLLPALTGSHSFTHSLIQVIDLIATGK